MSKSTLEQTVNKFKSTGYLYETSLKKEPCDINLYQDGAKVGTKKGERIRGNVSIKTDYGVHTFDVFFQSLNREGKQSNNWEMATKMLNWNPEINGDSEQPVSFVQVSGRVEINDYLSKDGTVKSYLRWQVSSASTCSEQDVTRKTGLEATLYLQAMSPEIRNNVETGRLKLTLFGANRNGACFPITAFVESDQADDFESSYDIGMTIPLDMSYVTRNIGGAKNKRKFKFGKSSGVDYGNSYQVTELIVAGGENEIEEPESLYELDDEGNEVPVKTQWIDPAVMQAAIRERNKMLAEMKDKAKDGNNKNNAEKPKMKPRMQSSGSAPGRKVQRPKQEPEYDEDYEDENNFDDPDDIPEWERSVDPEF